MPDEMDSIQEFNDNFIEDARKEHSLKMNDMEMISPNPDDIFECEDCGIPLPVVTRARLKYDMLLCGTCFGYHKHDLKVGKMREGYD